MNPPQSDVVKLELHPISEEDDLGFIACMTIDRPDKLNALNADVLVSLKAVCDWMEATDEARVLVVFFTIIGAIFFVACFFPIYEECFKKGDEKARATKKEPKNFQESLK